MMSLKLDTPALERLMQGDDGKIKLELQQAVVEEFSRRHIKSIVNDSVFRNHIDSIREESSKHLESLFGEWKGSWGNKKLELNPQIRDMIQLQAKTAVTYELDQVEAHVQQIYKEAAEKIKSRYEQKLETLNGRLDHYLNELEVHTDKIKAQLITEKVDGVLRSHIKSILAESFATA